MMPSRLPQTTILLVHPDHIDQAAVICSLLGDEVKTRSLGYQANIVRVVTADPNAFLQADNPLVPLKWRCHEQQLPGNRWITHLGAPDGVYPLPDLHRAIVGVDTHDDGGMADGLILCCGGRHTLEMLHLVAGALEKIPKISPPFVIGFTGSFRSLDWLARQVRWGPLSRCIALCGFVSPLWYCRVVQPGLVLMVLATTNYWQPAKLFARPPSSEKSCHKLWNSILQATKSKRIDRLPPQVSTNGAAMLYSQLQDASIIMFPCLLVARSPTRIGKLMLGMVKDFYTLFHHLKDHIPEWRQVALEDNLLFNLVGSRLCVEWTNNSAMEILERISSNRAPLRRERLLEFCMTRQAQYQWHLSTSSSPLDNKEIDNSEPSVQNTFVDDALSHGLLLVLGIAQLMGLKMEQELSTTLHVVRQLQCLEGKSFVEVYGEGIRWNSNQLVDALTPRAHGLSSLEELLSFVSRDPTVGYKLQWPVLQSRI
jgi:hypothetical protein